MLSLSCVCVLCCASVFIVNCCCPWYFNHFMHSGWIIRLKTSFSLNFSVWHHVCFRCDSCIRPAIVFSLTQECQLKKYAEFRVVISVRQAKTFTAHPNVRPICYYFSGSKTGRWFPPALSSPIVLGGFLNRRFEFLIKNKRVRACKKRERLPLVREQRYFNV